jgi:prophage maintenance system killer protein
MAHETQYLTVQDHLWMNLQVTKKQPSWNFAKLEQAVYYQYAYGRSTDLIAQAARYLHGFIKNAPFESGNAATAGIGLATFLKLNGYELKVDAKGLRKLVESSNGTLESCESELRKATQKSHHHDHAPSVSEAGEWAVESFLESMAGLKA